MKSGRGGLVALALLLLANLACGWFPVPFLGPGALPLEEEIRRKTFADDPLATATFRIVGRRHVR
ncbi:MAG TPA: hypothetical protein VER55_02815, partial [Ardenticatenaceae bacterium]|nr:hypothetical protein [Ardenticatenaceae bacterium]